MQKTSPWQKLLEQPRSREHFVQLYGAGGPGLAHNVGYYLAEGIKRGDGVVLIATADHLESFLSAAAGHGADRDLAVSSGQVVALDAAETLARFMTGGQPIWYRFESAMLGAIRRIHKTEETAGLRAYGEMVAILWKARQYAAAIQLERYWNRLLEQLSCSLFCAYSVDIFGSDFQSSGMDGILCAHTHLLPSHPEEGFESALNSAFDEVLGEDAAPARARMKGCFRPSWALMPPAESMLLWLRNHLPEQAERIVRRARQSAEPQ